MAAAGVGFRLLTESSPEAVAPVAVVVVVFLAVSWIGAGAGVAAGVGLRGCAGPGAWIGRRRRLVVRRSPTTPR